VLLATASSEATRIRGVFAYPPFFFRSTPPPKFHDEEIGHDNELFIDHPYHRHESKNIQGRKRPLVLLTINRGYRRASFTTYAEDVLQHPTFCSGPTSSSYSPFITRRSQNKASQVARRDREAERVRMRVRVKGEGEDKGEREDEGEGEF
jgi:hypothetical protein